LLLSARRRSLSAKPLSELIEELSPYGQRQVRDFVEFLLLKRRRQAGRPLQQSWAGALTDYRHQYTALELQEKALEWLAE
jgi:hypothetical protein